MFLCAILSFISSLDKALPVFALAFTCAALYSLHKSVTSILSCPFLLQPKLLLEQPNFLLQIGTIMRNSSLSLLLLLGLITMATSSWTTMKKKKNLRKRLKPRDQKASTGNLRASNHRITSKRVVRIHTQSAGKEKLRVWRKKHGLA